MRRAAPPNKRLQDEDRGENGMIAPKRLPKNHRGPAHFAESAEQNVPVPFSADGSGIGPKNVSWWLFPIAVIAATSGAEHGFAATPMPRSIAITNVSVFDSPNEQMLPPQSVLIEGGRIKAVGAAVSIPKDAQLIDGHGQFLIPGLIDAHVHLVHLSDRTHVAGEEFLPLFLGAGVTSVRSTGDGVEAEKRIAQYVEKHPELCPQIYLASPLVDGDPPFHNDVGLAITKTGQIPMLVDEWQHAGVTTVKLYVGTTREIGQQVIAEAHQRGLVVTGHLGRYAAQDAVADGIDCLEHIWSVIDYIVPRGQTRANVDLNNPRAQQLIAAIKQHNVAVDPTLVVFRDMVTLGDQPEFVQHPDNARVPERMKVGWQHLLQERQFTPESLGDRQAEFRKYEELTGVLYRAGVPLLAGTDAPEPSVCPGFSLHQELELLVESGLPAAAALSCATLHNARILKQDKNLGSIEAGKQADLVLLRNDPVKDIRNTRSIAKVIHAGLVLDADKILQAVPAK
jgi:Amidohydrolase family